jgi:hypothetical protein
MKVHRVDGTLGKVDWVDLRLGSDEVVVGCEGMSMAVPVRARWLTEDEAAGCCGSLSRDLAEPVVGLRTREPSRSGPRSGLAP